MKEIKKADIQFEYTLVTATTSCPFCGKEYNLKRLFKNLKDFTCKCGAEIKLPQHYNNVYHNKTIKAKRSDTKWI